MVTAVILAEDGLFAERRAQPYVRALFPRQGDCMSWVPFTGEDSEALWACPGEAG